MSEIAFIFIATERAAPMQSLVEAEAITDRGLAGDRLQLRAPSQHEFEY
ncbi:MAG: hypothetical protein AAGB13_04645 [Cyanobacteria bacterium P01_F01_bin.33]